MEGQLRRATREVAQGHGKMKGGIGKLCAARERLDHLPERHDLRSTHVENPALEAAALGCQDKGIDHLVDIQGMAEIVSPPDVEEAPLLEAAEQLRSARAARPVDPGRAKHDQVETRVAGPG